MPRQAKEKHRSGHSRPTSSTSTSRRKALSQDFRAALAEVSLSVERANKPIVSQLQALLDAEFRSLQARGARGYGSMEANRDFVSGLNTLLRRLDKRIKCPKCGKPSTLVLATAAGAVNGAFTFRHDTTRTVHGGTTALPPLKLCPPAPDRRRRLPG